MTQLIPTPANNSYLRKLRGLGQDVLHEIYASDEWRAIFLEAFKARLQAHQRDATNAYFYGAIKLGIDPTIVHNWYIQLGVQTESDALRIAEVYHAAQALTPEEQVIECAELIVQLVEEDPSLARVAMRVLSKANVVSEGDVAENGDSHHLPPHTNGEAHS